MKTIAPPLKKLPTRWVLISLASLLFLLMARQTTLANSSGPRIAGNQPAAQGSTASAPAQAPAAVTATPTSTRTLPAAPTLTPVSAPETTLRVGWEFINLRSGPDTKFTVAQKVLQGEVLKLLGRLSDNSWLYVQTSQGQEGWVKKGWVKLDGIDLSVHPQQTPQAPQTLARVTGDPVNLRTGPSTAYTKVQTLTRGDRLQVNGRLGDNSWLYVKTSDGAEGWVEASLVDLAGDYMDYDQQPILTAPVTPTSTLVVLQDVEGRWIDIDLSEQKLYAYEGATLIAEYLVSTGISSFPTETGTYRIQVKWRYSDMRGADYYLPDVPFSMYYNRDFSIHGTYWHHSFGTPMSHGCVNMDTRDAEWLYNWAPVGTLVNIHH